MSQVVDFNLVCKSTSKISRVKYSWKLNIISYVHIVLVRFCYERISLHYNNTIQLIPNIRSGHWTGIILTLIISSSYICDILPLIFKNDWKMYMIIILPLKKKSFMKIIRKLDLGHLIYLIVGEKHKYTQVLSAGGQDRI